MDQDTNFSQGQEGYLAIATEDTGHVYPER
jgi:hypothetical protein